MEPRPAQPDDAPGYLEGQLLIAMPGMRDPRFHRTLIYLCAHSAEGAMGLIVNKPAESLSVSDLLERLEIPVGGRMAAERVRFGGPVETGRGFVLHSADYDSPQATLRVDDSIAMTATLDILHAIARDEGPTQAIVALGYAGWAPGQLESEMQANGWLNCAADPWLLFGAEHEGKWDRAMAKLGVDPALLSIGGRA